MKTDMRLNTLDMNKVIDQSLDTIVGYNASNSYKVAFGKPYIKPVTAASAASKLVNDRKIQCELWRLAHYLDNGLIEFNRKVLKLPCPLS